MRITLFLLSLVAAAGGAALLSMAESPIDEIGALMLLVVAATLLAAAAVVATVTRSLQAAERTNETLNRILEDLNERNADSSRRNEDVGREPAYVVRTGNDSSGPFAVDKIKELRRRGAIDDDTPVALAGRNEWKRTCEVIGV